MAKTARSESLPKGSQQREAVRPGDERQVVRRIIAASLGGKIRRIEPESGGLSNLVFSVDHSSAELIVRLNPHPDKRSVFLKEWWATGQAREVGVPVAEILEVGDDPIPYMILRKTKGDNALGHPDRVRILRELAGYAAVINSIRTRGFGASFDWDRNQLSPLLSWDGFLDQEFLLEKRLRALRRVGRLPASQIDAIRQVLKDCGKSRAPALNHGDLRLKNVLVNGRGRIAAILDWENCTSTLAPEWELALALHDLNVDEKEEFVSAYGIRPRALAAIAPVLKALNLTHYAGKLEGLTKRKDQAQLERYRARLKGALDLNCPCI